MMMLGNFHYRGVLLVLIIVIQGPAVLAIVRCVGGWGAEGVMRIFFLSLVIYLFFLPLSRRRFDAD